MLTTVPKKCYIIHSDGVQQQTTLITISITAHILLTDGLNSFNLWHKASSAFDFLIINWSLEAKRQVLSETSAQCSDVDMQHRVLPLKGFSHLSKCFVFKCFVFFAAASASVFF